MRVVVILVLGMAGVRGAVAGAWETFFNQKNTNAWIAYDSADAKDYYPSWISTPVGKEHASFSFARDKSFSFIALQNVGGGAFTGNYQAQNISGIRCDVLIGSLAALDYMDCSLLATGPSGRGVYYSETYEAADFDGDGWWSLNYSFGRSWYFWNETEWVSVSPKSLTGIEQLIFTFVPKVGSAGGSRIGLDNVTLEPTVVAPVVTTSLTAQVPPDLRLAFTPGPGLEARIEKLRNPVTLGWANVAGQTSIKGPSSHIFLAPTSAGTGIFRVAAEPFYTRFVTP